MTLVKWDPARELDALQGDVNRIFDSFFQGRGGTRGNGADRRWLPPMDLTENDSEYLLRADLPGLSEDDVEIEVRDDVLTVSGERKAEHRSDGEGFHRVERSFGRFTRSLDLPSGVDAEAVRASFERGVLEVRIPKPAEAKATRVPIGASAGSG